MIAVARFAREFVRQAPLVGKVFEVFPLDAIRALAVKISVGGVAVNLTRHSFLSQGLAFGQLGDLAFIGPILEPGSKLGN